MKYDPNSKFFVAAAVMLACLVASCNPYGHPGGSRPGSEDLATITITEPGVPVIEGSVDSTPEGALLVSGGVFVEFQKDMASGEDRLYAQAVFHEPLGKNILFPEISTAACRIPGSNGTPGGPPAVTPPPTTEPRPPNAEPCDITASRGEPGVILCVRGAR